MSLLEVYLLSGGICGSFGSLVFLLVMAIGLGMSMWFSGFLGGVLDDRRITFLFWDFRL